MVWLIFRIFWIRPVSSSQSRRPYIAAKSAAPLPGARKYILPGSHLHIAVLCNPLAGAGRSLEVASQLSRLLSDKMIPHQLFQGQWPGDLAAFTDVYLVGGDGTLQYYINHYPYSQLPLAIFGGGTGNDFHWLLYGQVTLEEQLNRVLQQPPRPVDMGRCNQRYFINGLGVGFEGAVAKALTSRNKLPGKTSYLLTILRQILTYRSAEYHISAEETVIDGRQLLVDVSNGSRAGGGFHVAPEARADDGLLDVVIVRALPPLYRMRYLPVIEKGRHLSLPFVTHFRTRSLQISCDKPIRYHLDGEYLEANEIHVSIVPGSLLFRY